MQTLAARGTRQGEVVLHVPRWHPEGLAPDGLPYRVVPVLSSLLRHGFDVSFSVGTIDDVEAPMLREALAECCGAVAWCAELNPGAQVSELTRFLELAHEVSPDTVRVAGGGFFYLAPPRMRNFGPLEVEILDDDGVPSVAELLRTRLGAPPLEDRGLGGSRVRFPDPLALYQLDLRPFFRPEALTFGNEELALQLPTGFGCAKRCPFCFFERTRVRLLDAGRIVDVMGHVRERYGVRLFLLGEYDFLTSPKRAVEVARRLVERGIDVRWFALASISDVDRLSDAELELLAESGCHVLELGTEAGSNEAIRRLGKDFDVETAVRCTRRLAAVGIVPLHNMILGLVGETSRDRRDTVALTRRLKEIEPRVQFNFFMYQAAPNTTMGDEAWSHLPDVPGSIPELGGQRIEMENGRTMPWLSSAGEREARFLAEYLLPLAFDDALAEGRGRRSLTRRLLSGVANLRCRTGIYALPLDRAWFRRVESVKLPGTFVP